jgi:hypothetical protein
MEVFQGQPLLDSLQTVCNRRLPMQGSTSLLFQMVLSQNYAPMLLVEKSSHPYYLPPVECTKVGLPHPFGILVQREFSFLRADWGFAFSHAQVQ